MGYTGKWSPDVVEEQEEKARIHTLQKMCDFKAQQIVGLSNALSKILRVRSLESAQKVAEKALKKEGYYEQSKV